MTRSLGSVRARIAPGIFLSAAVLWSMIAAFPALCLDKPVEVGQTVPEFSLPDLEGRTVSFERDIRGKAPLTLLFFMTTACSPCFEELRELNDFIRRNPGKIGIWSIAVDLRGLRGGNLADRQSIAIASASGSGSGASGTRWARSATSGRSARSSARPALTTPTKSDSGKA